MKRFDFEVLKGERVSWAVGSRHLQSVADAWPRVVEIAGRFSEPGHRIRVTDEEGSIVILVGVASARFHDELTIVGQADDGCAYNL